MVRARQRTSHTKVTYDGAQEIPQKVHLWPPERIVDSFNLSAELSSHTLKGCQLLGAQTDSAGRAGGGRWDSHLHYG